MFGKFREGLERRGLPYTPVRGNYQEREEFLVNEIERMLNVDRNH